MIMLIFSNVKVSSIKLFELSDFWFGPLS